MGNQAGTVIGQDKTNELLEKLDLYAVVLSVIQDSYVEERSSKDMIYSSLEGMLSSLDPHSGFLRPEKYREMQIDTGGHFGGLGMEIVVRDEALLILSTLSDTPAARAGLKSGDKIVRINGEVLDKPDLNNVLDELRGPVGSKVEVSIFRPEQKQYISVEMVREDIHINSVVKAVVIPGSSAGYIKIIKFQENTAKEFKDSADALLKQGVDKMILDLRGNPGGLLDEAFKLAGYIIGGDKLIVSTRGRLSEQNSRSVSDKTLKPLSCPIAILINDGSASGSEVVSGAVQDWEQGVIVGETSFGKGSVQSLIPLKDGSALRLTTAYYYTPKGRLIHNKGIEPDIKVALTNEDMKFYHERYLRMKNGEDTDQDELYADAQIKAALDFLKQQSKAEKNQEHKETSDADSGH